MTAELVSRLAKLRADGRFEEVCNLLDHMMVGTKYERGFARHQLALTLYTQSTRNLRRCLELTDLAISDAGDDDDLMSQVLINGLLYADMASDTERGRNYCLRLRLHMARPTVSSGVWRGRCLNNLAQFYSTREPATAKLFLVESVRWHQRHVGPYGERDRRCYLGRALASLAEISATEGDLDAAQNYLRQATEWLTDTRPDMIAYIAGLVAGHGGDVATSIERLEAALIGSRERRDYDLSGKCVRALVKAYVSRGRRADATATLRPMIVDFAHAGLVARTVEFQRLAKSVASGE